MRLLRVFKKRKNCVDGSYDGVPEEENISHILVIRFSSMGDVVLVAGVLPALEDAWPQAHIHLVTDERYTSFYEDDARIHRVHSVTKKNRRKVFKELAGLNWDFVLDLQNNRCSKGYRQKYFADVRSGALDKLHGKRLLLLLFRHNRYNFAENVVFRYIRAAGLKPSSDHDQLPPVRLTFQSGPKERGFEHGAGDKKKLALFPFCAWKNKQWPLEFYLEIGREALRRNWYVCIFGGPTDQPVADSMALELGAGADSFAGRRTLHEVGAMLTDCNLALGNDTGLSHLARACGVATGMIFGSTTRHWGFYPYGSPPYRVFETELTCRPCHAHGGNFCFRGSRQCLLRITPHMVISGLENLDKECNRQKRIPRETEVPDNSESKS